MTTARCGGLLAAATLSAGFVLGGSSLARGQSATLSPAEQRGLTFVRVNCSRCHAIGKVGDSPLRVPPHSVRCIFAILLKVSRRRLPKES